MRAPLTAYQANTPCEHSVAGDSDTQYNRAASARSHAEDPSDGVIPDSPATDRASTDNVHSNDSYARQSEQNRDFAGNAAAHATWGLNGAPEGGKPSVCRSPEEESGSKECGACGSEHPVYQVTPEQPCGAACFWRRAHAEPRRDMAMHSRGSVGAAWWSRFGGEGRPVEPTPALGNLELAIMVGGNRDSGLWA